MSLNLVTMISIVFEKEIHFLGQAHSLVYAFIKYVLFSLKI